MQRPLAGPQILRRSFVIESLRGITQNWRRDIHSFPSGKTLLHYRLTSSFPVRRVREALIFSNRLLVDKLTTRTCLLFAGFQRLATIRMSQFVILAFLCLMKCFVKNQLLAQTLRDLRTLLWLDGKLHMELFALWHLHCRRRAVCFSVCKISLYPPS